MSKGRYRIMTAVRWTAWTVGFELIPQSVVLCLGPLQICVWRMTYENIMEALSDDQATRGSEEVP